MQVVQPIRDLDTLQKCYEIAREHDKHRKTGEVSWELILVVGFNTSLRVSDFRRFKVSDLRGKDYAQIQAKKTGKDGGLAGALYRADKASRMCLFCAADAECNWPEEKKNMAVRV